MKSRVAKIVRDSLEVKEKLLKENLEVIVKVTEAVLSAYKKNKKVIVFGNGGSAADSQHLAAELVVRFEQNRKSLDCVALTTNSSAITAIGNDYGFDQIFAKQVESIVKAGDVVIGISTSGNSQNVLSAIEQAKKQKALTIGWTGRFGGRIKNIADLCICVPSENTARIQEGHVLIIHIISKLVEEELFKT
ncbi:MAG: D-sedoheptulose 7-phosphate isomerase [Elusimicrobia bacterium]|nr:D-sedoheptulose 7-phosphate isomerase [Elusimicrobiota bacterium]MBU2614553.1 D-sedoheptulose 7-phosphate isomerase [Elusimicrobiota bacterium]